MGLHHIVTQCPRLHQSKKGRPVTDAAILPLSEARAQFEEVCQLALPEETALAVTRDKLKTLELAERVGVPGPTTDADPDDPYCQETYAARGISHILERLRAS